MRSLSQTWKDDENNAPVHCDRGPVVAWRGLASDATDEANARMETKAAVEMANMVERSLR